MPVGLELSGQRFGKLLVVTQRGYNKHKNRVWECVCDCGKTYYTTSACLMKRLDAASCGCSSTGCIDLSGQTFGRWTVLSRASRSGKKTMWNCRCSCGTERAVDGWLMKSGGSKSCGCRKIENVTRACVARARMTEEDAFWNDVMWQLSRN